MGSKSTHQAAKGNKHRRNLTNLFYRNRDTTHVSIPRISDVLHFEVSPENGRVEKSIKQEIGAGDDCKVTKSRSLIFKLRSEEGDRDLMENWHGSQFLAYGIHEIEDRKDKEVFFINHYRLP